MQIQSIGTQIQEYFAQFSTQKIAAIALSVLGALSLAASALLAPVATPITTALLIGGASVFVTGFFLNFYSQVKAKIESAKGLWTNEGKQLEIVLQFESTPLQMRGAEFTDDHKIKIDWNDSQEMVVEFNKIPSMINLVDINSKFTFEKIAPAEWLKQFSKIDILGHNINNETTYVQLAFS